MPAHAPAYLDSAVSKMTAKVVFNINDVQMYATENLANQGICIFIKMFRE